MLMKKQMCLAFWRIYTIQTFLKAFEFSFSCLIVCWKFQWGKVWSREVLEVISVAFQDSRDIFCAKKEEEHMWGLLQVWNIVLRVSQRPLYNNLDFRIYYIGYHDLMLAPRLKLGEIGHERASERPLLERSKKGDVIYSVRKGSQSKLQIYWREHLPGHAL